MQNENIGESTNISLFAKRTNNDFNKSTVPELQKNIENGEEVKFYFQRLLKFDSILTTLAALNILLTILYADADFINDTPNTAITLYVMLGLQSISILVTIFRYRAQVQLEISETQLSKFDNIFSAQKYQMFAELFILLLQPYPFLNNLTIDTINIRNKYTFPFKINYLLVILGFTRIFIVARVFLLNTEYMSPRANRVCRLYEAKSDYLYAIKCLFKDVPMKLIGVVFVASIIIFALSLRIAERNLISLDRLYGVSVTQDLQSFSNALWLTIITMTTLGYGDFYPRTLIGRFIDVILIIWGIFIVSLMVVVLTNTLNMDLSEKRALTVLNRLDLKAVQKKHAANYIINAWKRQKQVRIKKQLLNNSASSQNMIVIDREIEKYDLKLNQYSKQLKQINRTMQSLFETDDIYENMTRQFQNLMDEIEQLMKDQNTTEENLKKFLQAKREALSQKQAKRKKLVKFN